MDDPDAEIITASLERLVGRLRSASENRLTRKDDQLGGQSLASASYELSVWCVDRYEQVTDTPLPDLPVLHPFASGDQLWATGMELVQAIAADDGAASLRQELLDRINELRRVS